MQSRFQKYEFRALDWIYENLRSRKADRIMHFVSVTGNLGVIWLAAALTLYITRVSPEASFCILGALFCSALLVNMVLKKLTHRTRPFILKEDRETLISPPCDFSFPSGHTFSSFAAATAIFLNAPRLGILALIYASGIAFSRLYLYVHFLSDVLCSAVFGVATGMMVCYLFNINFVL
jgi:undecaprenyl-diphosphatase